MTYTLLKGQVMHLFGAYPPDFDLLIIVIAYLSVKYGHVAASAYALGQGFFMDVLSGGALGIFTLTYLVVFWGLLFGSYFVELNHPRGQATLVALAMLLKEILFIGMVELFSPHTSIGRAFPAVMGGSILLTGLSAPILFSFFDYLRGRSLARDEQ